MYAHYLSYATFVTSEPVLGAEQFQFPRIVIFHGFSANVYHRKGHTKLDIFVS